MVRALRLLRVEGSILMNYAVSTEDQHLIHVQPGVTEAISYISQLFSSVQISCK